MGRKGEGRKGRGTREGRGRDRKGGHPPIFYCTPSSSFLEICLLATADRLSSFVLCCKNFGYQEH